MKAWIAIHSRTNAVPVRPDTRAAGVADAGRAGGAADRSTAHPRSSNHARSRARPRSHGTPPASLRPASGQSRHTAHAQATMPEHEPQRAADDCSVCRDAWTAGSRGTVLLEATQQTKYLPSPQPNQRTGITDAQPSGLHPQQHLKAAELLLAHRHHRNGASPATPEPAGVSPLLCRGVSSVYCGYKACRRPIEKSRFLPDRNVTPWRRTPALQHGMVAESWAGTAGSRAAAGASRCAQRSP